MYSSASQKDPTRQSTLAADSIMFIDWIFFGRRECVERKAKVLAMA
jgi:hypothetical protein